MKEVNCWVVGSFPALRAAIIDLGLSISSGESRRPLGGWRGSYKVGEKFEFDD